MTEKETTKKIDAADVQKLARLTRLKLSPAEEAEAAASLGAVLGLVDELQQADLGDIGGGENVPPYVQLRGQTLRTRPPEAEAGFAREKLMDNAPEADGEHFLVPKVVE